MVVAAVERKSCRVKGLNMPLMYAKLERFLNLGGEIGVAAAVSVFFFLCVINTHGDPLDVLAFGALRSYEWEERFKRKS